MYLENLRNPWEGNKQAQLKNERGKNFLHYWDLIHGSLQPKSPCATNELHWLLKGTFLAPLILAAKCEPVLNYVPELCEFNYKGLLKITQFSWGRVEVSTWINNLIRNILEFKILRNRKSLVEQFKTYSTTFPWMQWAAVRICSLSIRVPPHLWTQSSVAE